MLRTITQFISKSFSVAIWYSESNGNSGNEEVRNMGYPPSHVFSWGKSEDGRLGHNTLNPCRTPRRIPSKWFSKSEIIDVYTGYTHSFAVSASSELFCWGNNWYGQLGIGDEDNSLGPYRLKDDIWEDILSQGIEDIACGENHSLLCTKEGNCYSWGMGGNFLNQGGLGHGDKKNKLLPIRIEEGIAEYENAIEVAAGRFHSGILMDTGILYTFGRGDWGRLGHGKVKNEKIPKPINPESYYERGGKITSVDFGAAHSAFITENGLLYTFGKAENFVLGIDSSNTLVSGASLDGISVPSEVTFFSDQDIRVKDVSCGTEMTACITKDGDCYVWGKSAIVPFKVDFEPLGIGNAKVKNISVGNQHVGIVTEDNGAFIIGTSNLYGQLGLVEGEEILIQSSVREIHKIDENEFIPRKVRKIACGEDFSIAVMDIR